MVEKQKYQAYASAVQTVAPVRQIIMLYDKIIQLVQQSKEAIAEKRIEDRYNLLIKASELVGGLQACLDFDNGGNIARILYSYYSAIDARLFELHRTNNIDDCESIIADLKQMRDAWMDVEGSSNQSAESADDMVVTPPANSDVPPDITYPTEGMTISA